MLTDGQAIIEFGDGTLVFKTIPYQQAGSRDKFRIASENPEPPFFLGVTDTRGIRSIRIGQRSGLDATRVRDR